MKISDVDNGSGTVKSITNDDQDSCDDSPATIFIFGVIMGVALAEEGNVRVSGKE